MDNYQNNPGVPPINPEQTQMGGQSYGQPYEQSYGQQYDQQSYQQYQQQGFPNFTGQGSNGSLHVTDYGRSHLKSIAGWTKFLSIVMMIMIILGIVIFLMAAINVSDFMPSRSLGYGYDYRGASETIFRIVFIFYIVVLAIFLLPTIWALLSASKLKKAALYGGPQDLEDGLRLWKNVCVFFGVLTIIYLAFFVLVVIAFIAGA